MARRGRVYPQVGLQAREMVDTPTTACPVDVSAAEALQLARRRHARALVQCLSSGRRSLILIAHLERAVEHGFGSLPAHRLRIPVAVVEATASEVAVRRRLLEGAGTVLITDGGQVIGAVGRAAVPGSSLVGVSLANLLSVRLPAHVVSRITAFARNSERRGRQAFLIGDAVRDAVLSAMPSAVSGAADGEAPEMTASRPGPDGIEAILTRRGFTLDAMAAELSSGAFGLVDPFGGRHDAARRRLRVMDPLAFADDPRLSARAARWTALGFTLDAAARRAQAIAQARDGSRDDPFERRFTVRASKGQGRSWRP